MSVCVLIRKPLWSFRLKVDLVMDEECFASSMRSLEMQVVCGAEVTSLVFYDIMAFLESVAIDSKFKYMSILSN